MQPPPLSLKVRTLLPTKECSRRSKDIHGHSISLNNYEHYQMKEFPVDDPVYDFAIWDDQAILEGSAETPDHLIEKFDTGIMPVNIGTDPPLTEGSTPDTTEMVDPQHTYLWAIFSNSPLFKGIAPPNTTCCNVLVLSTNCNYVEYMETKGHSKRLLFSIDLTPGNLVLLKTNGCRGRRILRNNGTTSHGTWCDDGNRTPWQTWSWPHMVELRFFTATVFFFMKLQTAQPPSLLPLPWHGLFDWTTTPMPFPPF